LKLGSVIRSGLWAPRLPGTIPAAAVGRTGLGMVAAAAFGFPCMTAAAPRVAVAAMPATTAAAWSVVRREAMEARLPTFCATEAAAMLAARTAVVTPPAMRALTVAVSRTKGGAPVTAAESRSIRTSFGRFLALSGLDPAVFSNEHARSAAQQQSSL